MSSSPAARARSPRQLWIFTFILAVEYVAVAHPHPDFIPNAYKGVTIVFGLALLFFGRSRLGTLGLEELPVRRLFLALHIFTLAVFAALGVYLVRFHAGGPALWLWWALFPPIPIFLLLSFVPAGKLAPVVRTLGPASVYAALCSALLVLIRALLRSSWNVSTTGLGLFLQNACFAQTSALLKLFYPVVISDRPSHLLGTNRFLVEIAGQCSGVEGLALITAFILVWFLFDRRHLRISRALLLVPLALGLMWTMNLWRLVLLIAIGSSGHPAVAINGFHSEAGWISFTTVSLGFLLVAQRWRWFRKDDRAPSVIALDQEPTATAAQNVPATYLAPFLAITAASVVAQAVSGHGFEWLYPLRLVAALAVLWSFRNRYRSMDWHFGPLGPAAGALVACLWLGGHYWTYGSHPTSVRSDTLAASLGALSPLQRGSWIVIRALAAITTVPIAEELAFRGFLARRIMSARVTTVPFSTLSALAILASSFAFGLMHGRQWLLGFMAGIVFALVAKFRGRLGEAVAAHASANLILASVVLFRNDYTLW